MTLSKKLVLALAGTSLLAPLAGHAQEIASLSGRAAINEYSQQQDNDTFRAWASTNQVTSVNQFSDVKPTDWAYQALSNLVEKYGCVAGYPDGKFKGAQAMTRFEAAAILNACLDRVTEKTDELRKLLDEFDKELTILTARVDGLESKVARLQAQQFSTTTKLKGEASMILGGIPNYYYQSTANSKGQRYGSTTFNYDVRLSFDTSYTGQDLLRTRLRSGNFTRYPFGSGSTPFKLDKAEELNNQVFIDRLYYTFPVGQAKSVKLTVGALVRNTELAWIPSAYKSDVLDLFTLGGASSVYNKATGQGVGFQWKQNAEKGKPFWVFNANYVVNGTCQTNAASGACTTTSVLGGSGADGGYGVFNSKSGLNGLVQLGYKAPQWGVAVGYRYGTAQSAARDGNGAAGNKLSDSYGTAGLPNQSSNAVAGNIYWQPATTGAMPSISFGYAYNSVSKGTGYNIATSASSSSQWFVGLQWDDAFVKGNAAGMAVGQPPHGAGGHQSAPYLIEWFYRIQATDNISVTPTLFYGTNIANSDAAVNQGFTGLGGVIQTTFKF